MPVVLRRAMLVAGALLFGALPFAPALVWGGGPWAGYYAFECGLALLALAFSSRTRFARSLRFAVVGLYALLVVFLVYEHVFRAFFRRDPALGEDWHLLINLVHFVGASSMFVVSALAAVLGFASVVLATNALLAILQREIASVNRRTLVIATAIWALAGGLSIALGGPIRVAGASIVANYRASVEARRRLSALGDGTHDRRYEGLGKARLARRPDVYVLVIEAYGEVLATWDMTDAYRALMAHVGKRLDAAGYGMRTAYSTAPVFGGRSWYSLATMQSGILINQPEAFEAFLSVSSRIPTLIGFFRAQGYATASLEPATKPRAGLANDDPYAHDLRIDAPKLAYEGRSWGFGEIPDQYSLETFRARHLPGIREPRYVFYMGVSTHYPWTSETVPSFEGGGEWPSFDTSGIGSDFRKHYFASIDYEFRALVELLENDPSRDIVVFVIGDHQPRLESNAPGEVSFRTPVHVLSRDRAFVERFDAWGFQAGLFAEPGHMPTLRHEGLFSLFVTVFVEAYGTLESQGLPHYFPDGITLAGLNP